MKNPFSTHVIIATIQSTFNFLSYLISNSQISTSLRYDHLVLNMKEQRHRILDHLLKITRRFLPRVLSSCRWRLLKRGVLWEVLFQWKQRSIYQLGRPNPSIYLHSQVILCFILRDTD